MDAAKDGVKISEKIISQLHQKFGGNMMAKLIDITGKRFGRLVVIERSKKCDKRKHTYWICKCDCGNEKVISREHLIHETTKSCGCLGKEVKRITIKKNIKKFIDNPNATSRNQSTGIKNIRYAPNQGFACYEVSIIRENNKYRQYFSTLREAERAKEYVLKRYKKGVPNWYGKL